MRIAVIVPFLNEQSVLGAALAALAEQTRSPDRVVLVDDGSTDGSRELAEAFAAQHSYASAITRPPRPAVRDRLATASEFVAFQQAVRELRDWDVVGKLDADIRLPPGALAELEHQLEKDPGLGIVGTFLSERGPQGDDNRIVIGEGHVHGATKFYRRACWEQIDPVPAILGWDTIDELTAGRAGWRTQSIALPGGDPEHLRPRGAHDGLLRAHRRWGACAHAFGEPLPLVLAEATRMLPRRPRVLGGVGYVTGWLVAAARRSPRADPALRSWVRRERYKRLRRRAAGR